MDKYLIDLVKRMNETGDQLLKPTFRSDETISWKALRETEKLNKPEFISQLIDFINNEKNKKARDRAYFALGHLAKNTNNTFATDYLIQRIEKETDKYVLSTLLDRITDLHKSYGTDLSPIIKQTKNKNWLVRYSAIRALNHTNDERAEQTLIEILEQSNDPNDLIYGSATLFKVGTLKAIPLLEQHLKSPKRDVKLSVKAAIEEIRKRNQ
ncbi:HEAT repeat domain-containing protein [Roseivirga pacifica]|uniref:HEAT repeat domain-containing protein n=1 Tax=Roseivirga pacifica TaxID=1267423 RepID=UPI00227CD1FE|nr:HEAT repeat domain-containing protein [Roseivirga pacifica]